MASSFAERWWRGLGLSFLALVILGIAWGIPQAAGEWLAKNESVPWLRDALMFLWILGMLVFCPLAFEWLTRVTGFIPPKKSQVIQFPGREGTFTRESVTPIAAPSERRGG